MEMQIQMHKMGLNPFLMFYIDAMLNFDSDVDANVKCEHTITAICNFTDVCSIIHYIPFVLITNSHCDSDSF